MSAMEVMTGGRAQVAAGTPSSRPAAARSPSSGAATATPCGGGQSLAFPPQGRVYGAAYGAVAVYVALLHYRMLELYVLLTGM